MEQTQSITIRIPESCPAKLQEWYLGNRHYIEDIIEPPWKKATVILPDGDTSFKGTYLPDPENPELKYKIRCFGIRSQPIVDIGTVLVYVEPGDTCPVLEFADHIGGEMATKIASFYILIMSMIATHQSQAEPDLDLELKELPTTNASKHKKSKGKKKPKPKPVYLLNVNSVPSGACPKGGHHSSPAMRFSVRGHMRHYRSGKTIWIKEHEKCKDKPLLVQSKDYILESTPTTQALAGELVQAPQANSAPEKNVSGDSNNPSPKS